MSGAKKEGTNSAARLNIQSRTLCVGDNLAYLRAINTDSIDLIATDPPFNKSRDFHATPDSLSAGASFQDRWRWDKDIDESWVNDIAEGWPAVKEVIESAQAAHSEGLAAFLCFMGVRLLEMHRVLKDTGSIYLHCDPTASHYLKALMDAIFGAKNFRNEIVWQRAAGRAKGNSHAPKSLGADCDYILHFAKGSESTFHGIYKQMTTLEIQEKFPYVDERGRQYNTDVPIFRAPSMGACPNLCYTYKGVTNPHPSGWRMSRSKLADLDDRGGIIWRKDKRPLRKSFAEDYKGKPIGSLWSDIPNITAGKERTGWPTQKPVALYERIIKASSNEGDTVLDPFCGCATTCVAAERNKRKWIGIDLWPTAAELVRDRMKELGETDNLLVGKPIIIESPPKRTDNGEPAVPALQAKKAQVTGRKSLFSTKDKAEKKAKLLYDKGCKCEGCGREFDHEAYLQIDHRIPRALFRSLAPNANPHDIGNLALLCGPCNIVKSDSLMTMDELKIHLTKLGQLPVKQ